MSRNHSNTRGKGDDIPTTCPVPGCGRKYKNLLKYQRHLETMHFYETDRSNTYTFDYITEIDIYTLVSKYLENLVIDSNVTPHDEIASQKRFAIQLFKSYDLESCDWTRVMTDFQRFIQMGIPYNDTNFYPTPIIDLFWRALMQNTRLHEQICSPRPGRIKSLNIIPSYYTDKGTPKANAKRREYFRKVYLYRYGTPVYEPPPAVNTSDNAYNFNKLQKAKGKIPM